MHLVSSNRLVDRPVNTLSDAPGTYCHMIVLQTIHRRAGSIPETHGFVAATSAIQVIGLPPTVVLQPICNEYVCYAVLPVVVTIYKLGLGVDADFRLVVIGPFGCRCYASDSYTVETICKIVVQVVGCGIDIILTILRMMKRT